MASKIHCDLCDASPAIDKFDKEVPVPGKQPWDRNRLTVNVIIYGRNEDEGRPAKDVCDDCRAKLVADAFVLRTHDEYQALRDEVNELTRQLALARAGEEPPGPPAPVIDPDIPF